MHKIIISETKNSHKLFLDKESFFEVGYIPMGSNFFKYIERSSGVKRETINFKDLVHAVTTEKLSAHGPQLSKYVK